MIDMDEEERLNSTLNLERTAERKNHPFHRLQGNLSLECYGSSVNSNIRKCQGEQYCALIYSSAIHTLSILVLHPSNDLIIIYVDELCRKAGKNQMVILSLCSLTVWSIISNSFAFYPHFSLHFL